MAGTLMLQSAGDYQKASFWACVEATAQRFIADMLPKVQ
jgi:hypothetical protein